VPTKFVFSLNLDWEGGLADGLQPPPLGGALGTCPVVPCTKPILPRNSYTKSLDTRLCYRKTEVRGLRWPVANTERQTRKAHGLGHNLPTIANRRTLKHTQSENGKVQMMSSHESAVRMVPHTPESPSVSSAGTSIRANLYQSQSGVSKRRYILTILGLTNNTSVG